MGGAVSVEEQPATVEESKKLEAPPDFKPAADRKCTDVIFLLLIISVWVAMTAVGIDGMQQGDPYLLINGVDYDGRICGRDAGVMDKSKFYVIRTDGTGVCVADCPETTDWDNLWGCTDGKIEYTVNYGFSCTQDQSKCNSLTGSFGSEASASNFGGTGYCLYQIESYDFLNHCIFTDAEIYEQFIDASEEVSYMQELMSDLYTTWAWTLGLGFSMSFVLGFVYCLLLRIPGVVCVLVWSCIFAVFGLLVALGCACNTLYNDWKDDNEKDDSQVAAAQVFSYIFWVCAALWVCLSLFLRKRITLATGIIKESARCINAIPVMILMPILQSIGLLAFLLPWFTYCAYTAGMADVKTGTTAGFETKSYEYKDNIVYRGWFLLFCFYWTTQFIDAMGQLILSISVVRYYFSRDKSTIGSTTFFCSLKDGLIYHTGTCAFGSLIIAIIKLIRSVIAYFQKKAKAAGNKIAEYLLCCCQCCMWCLEKCMKFINKNAYIQCAIFSTSFCKSAKNAFWLIARNIARVGAVSMVSEFVVVIMRILVTLAVCGSVYLGIHHTMANDVYSEIGPCIFAALIAYTVSGIFANLFNMCSLTILQCFIADEEMFGVADRYADNDLKEWIAANGGGKKKTPKSPKAEKSPRRRGKAAEAQSPVVVETGTRR